MKIDVKLVKQLREKSGVGVMEARKALMESKGDLGKAEKYLAKNAVLKANKKANRETKSGGIFTYVHNQKHGAMVKLACETDFVAKTDEFMGLGKEIAMQVVSSEAKKVEDLLAENYIRDPGKTIKDLIDGVVAKLGENIRLEEFSRLKVG